MSDCAVCRWCSDGHPSHKKDSTWAWLVCFGAATNIAFTFGLIWSYGVLLPVFMDYFKESRERTAWIGSLSVAFAFAAGPFAGSLINRFGCRTMSIVGCLTCALMLTLASFAKSLSILYVTYSVLGIGGSCVFLSSVVTVRKYFEKHQSIALGIVSAGQGLGSMVLSQVLQSLIIAVRWRNALRIVSGFLFVNSFFGIFYDSKMETTSSSQGDSLSSEEDEQKRTSKRFTLHCSVWKVPEFLVLAASGFLLMFGLSTSYVHLVKYSEDLGMSSDASSRLILYLGIATVTGRFGCGFLCSFKRLNNWYIFQGLLLVNGVSTTLLTLAQNYAAFVSYSVVFGFCDGAMATVLNIQAVTCVDHARAASAFGYLLMIASVTSLIGPPISGLIADKFGSYGPAFLLSGGLFITTSLIPFVMLCVKRPAQTNTLELSIDENKTVTGNVLQDKERNNLNEAGITGFVKRKRNSVNENLKVLFISSV